MNYFRFGSLKIEQRTSLADKNWFKTGGAARFFCEPTNEEEFKDAIIYAKQNDLPIFVLGDGANTLISDTGFDGLVLKPKINYIEKVYPEFNKNINQDTNQDENKISAKDFLVEAGAGVLMSDLINFCLDNNLKNLEEFSGIPGTVGGSVYINLHFFEFFLGNFLISARVIDSKTGEILTVDRSWFKFSYDYSTLHDKKYFLYSATFKVKEITPLEAAYEKGRSHERIVYRAWKYPTKLTCGSFFRNFNDDEISFEINGKKIKAVAYYFEKLNFRGQLSFGGAKVSEQHSNMIVNTGSATSYDIIMLARKMQELTLQEFGILPKSECVLIGFPKNLSLLEEQTVNIKAQQKPNLLTL